MVAAAIGVAALLGLSLVSAAYGDDPVPPPAGNAPIPAPAYDPQKYPYTKASDAQSSPAGRMPSGKLMEQARKVAEQQAIDAHNRQRVLDSAARVKARKQSRTAFAELGDDAAARLATQKFPTLLSEPAVGPLSRGMKADRYFGDFGAAVDGAAPGGKDAFVMSARPLRARNENGQLAPVDVSLRTDGDGWAPVNPLEEYRVAATANQGVSFPELGLAFRPVEQPVDGQVVGETIFYSDSLTDTDTIVKPLTDGVQYAWQLRSVNSPEELEVAVELPEGAALAQSGPDGVDIVRDGKLIGRIGAAVAADADGEPVATHLEVRGNRVFVVVDHRGDDVAYPVAVDPDFAAGYYFSSYGLPDAVDAMHHRWQTYSQPGDRHTLLRGEHWYGRGMYIQSPNYPANHPTNFTYNPGGGPGSADRAGYYWHAPGQAQIYKVYTAVSRHILGASLAQCMIYGITNADLNAWQGPSGYTWGEGCAPFNSYSWLVQTQAGGGSNGNAFLWGVYAYSANNQAFNTYVGDVEIWMSDGDAPYGPVGQAPGSPQLMVPKVFPEYNTNPQDPISAVANDRSSGVASLTFYGPASWTHNGMNGASGITVYNPTCKFNVCSNQFAEGVPIGNMPDGEQILRVVARDAAGNATSSWNYQVNFDLAPPPTPAAVEMESFDPGTSIAVMAVTPGTGDPDGADVSPEESPLVSISSRWRHPGAAWSPWQVTDAVHATNAQLGQTIEVEARATDSAGHVSGVLATTVVVAEVPVTFEEVPVQAAPGPGNSSLMVEVNAVTHLGDAVTPEAGLRVTLEQQSNGELWEDDTNASGVAYFPGLPADSYSVYGIGVGANPRGLVPSILPIPVPPNKDDVTEVVGVLYGKICSRVPANAACNMTKGEIDFQKARPKVGFEFIMDGLRASELAKEIYTGGDTVDLDGTRGNAFQHSLWTALMSISSNPSLGEHYANLHEMDNSGILKVMDVQNNAAGANWVASLTKKPSDEQACKKMRARSKTALGPKIAGPPAPQQLVYLRERGNDTGEYIKPNMANDCKWSLIDLP